MTISVAWTTGVITVEQSDLTPVGGSEYEHDINQFHKDLRTLEASQAGAIYPRTHDHNTEVALAGLLYARAVRILPPYTVKYEDLQYQVKAKGANHNVADVKVLNQVSLITENSAGLINAGLTQPEVRNAMTLPATESPQAGSIDSQLAALVDALVVHAGTAQAGAASTITLDATEASSTDEIYNGQILFITSGTGAEQTRRILAYDGITKVATMFVPWDVVPDDTSEYVIIPEEHAAVLSTVQPLLSNI
jgi:hypothetical protein